MVYCVVVQSPATPVGSVSEALYNSLLMADFTKQLVSYAMTVTEQLWVHLVVFCATLIDQSDCAFMLGARCIEATSEIIRVQLSTSQNTQTADYMSESPPHELPYIFKGANLYQTQHSIHFYSTSSIDNLLLS